MKQSILSVCRVSLSDWLLAVRPHTHTHTLACSAEQSLGKRRLSWQDAWIVNTLMLCKFVWLWPFDMCYRCTWVKFLVVWIKPKLVNSTSVLTLDSFFLFLFISKIFIIFSIIIAFFICLFIHYFLPSFFYEGFFFSWFVLFCFFNFVVSNDNLIHSFPSFRPMCSYSFLAFSLHISILNSFIDFCHFFSYLKIVLFSFFFIQCFNDLFSIFSTYKMFSGLFFSFFFPYLILHSFFNYVKNYRYIYRYLVSYISTNIYKKKKQYTHDI